MTARLPGRHILIIKLGALGDVALAIPQIARLLDTFAHDRVTLLTAPSYAGLARTLPGLEVVAFSRKGVLPMSCLLAWLIKQQFDAVYDLQGSLRSRIMTLLTQAPERFGPRPALAYTQASPPDKLRQHAFARFNAVLAVAGVAEASPRFRLQPGVAVTARVARWLRQHAPGGRPLVLLHAGGSPRWPSKRWPEAFFAELARSLVTMGRCVVWLGGDAERDVNRRLVHQAGIDATGAFDLVELVALGRCAACVISNDSGPMHVLALAGVPVYALFGPTDWRRSHAAGQSDRVLQRPLACSPCHLPVCPPQHAHACLAGITPQQVLARLQADGIV